MHRNGQKPCDTEVSSNDPPILTYRLIELSQGKYRNGFEGQGSQNRSSLFSLLFKIVSQILINHCLSSMHVYSMHGLQTRAMIA